MLDNSSDYHGEKHASQPILAASTDRKSGAVARHIGVKSVRRISANAGDAPGTMPNLMGYEAASAVRILEQRGVNVRLSGAGYVVAQSVDPSAPLRRGQTVRLTLKI